jgi:hypothetical protein
MSPWTKLAGLSRWKVGSRFYCETASGTAVTDSGPDPDLAVMVGSLISGEGIFK